MTGPDIARFWAKVNQDGPVPEHRPELGKCWLWTLSVQHKRGGYGQFRTGRRTRRAHIVAYELTAGPVFPGFVLDHLCRVPQCVNPAHLEPVSLAENIRRGMSPSTIAARMNRCRRGHEFNSVNTYRRPNGKRECRRCANDAQRQRRAA